MRNEVARSFIPASDGLTEGQRLNRICELLSKAVVRDWASRIVVERGAGGAPEEPCAPMAEASDGARVLSYLSLVGEASSALIRETLGLSKMRVYRAVHSLIRSGRVTAKGRSRMTTYALSRTEASKVTLN
ncbi:MAG: hypothetical protein H7343_11785 [Undibacterium sp.]|nr:hypothetical protein [Opitutaceae bacterium]